MNYINNNKKIMNDYSKNIIKEIKNEVNIRLLIYLKININY